MDIFEEIKALQLPQGEYVVVGSGPMTAHGLKEAHDVDIVLKPGLFEEYRKQNEWNKIPWTYPDTHPDKKGQVFLRKGNVELYLDVHGATFHPSTEKLIKRGDIINGVCFASLEDTLMFKKDYHKPKHVPDIALIEKYLQHSK